MWLFGMRPRFKRSKERELLLHRIEDPETQRAALMRISTLSESQRVEAMEIGRNLLRSTQKQVGWLRKCMNSTSSLRQLAKLGLRLWMELERMQGLERYLRELEIAKSGKRSS